MDDWYVSSISGDNGNDGYGPTDRTDPSQADNWSNAFEDLKAGFAAMGDGDNIFIASGHFVNYAVQTLYAGDNGTVTSVNTTTGAYLPGAVENCDSRRTLGTANKHIYTLGISFGTTNGNDFDAVSGGSFNIEDGALGMLSASNSPITIGVRQMIYLKNSDLTLPGSGNYIRNSLTGGLFKWNRGTLLTTAQSFLIKSNAGGTSDIKNVDLSIFTGAGHYFFELAASPAVGGSVNKISRCKLHASPPPLSSTIIHSNAAAIIMRSCDNGDDITFFQEKSFGGEIFKDTANYLTSDHSAKMVTSTLAKEFVAPLRYQLLSMPMDANPTINVKTLTDGVTLQNDEFWIEVDAPDADDLALGITVDSRTTDIRTTPTNLDTNSETWIYDVSTPIKQETEVVVTGGGAGIHTIYACFAKPNSTVFVERDATVS